MNELENVVDLALAKAEILDRACGRFTDLTKALIGQAETGGPVPFTGWTLAHVELMIRRLTEQGFDCGMQQLPALKIVQSNKGEPGAIDCEVRKRLSHDTPANRHD